MGWRLTWQGEIYRELDMTIGQAEQIEQLTGENWVTINPARTAKHALAILSVMHAHRTGRPLDEVRREVSDISVDQFITEVFALDDGDDDLPTEYTDGNPPPAVAPSTRGSSTSRSHRGVGRQH